MKANIFPSSVCRCCFGMSNELIWGFFVSDLDWLTLAPSLSPPPASPLSRWDLTARREGGASRGEKQKTWQGTLSVLLCNNWPTNIHLESRREAERGQRERRRERERVGIWHEERSENKQHCVHTLASRPTCTENGELLYVEVCAHQGSAPVTHVQGGLLHCVFPSVWIQRF